jgi:hypothetical protein
VVDSNISDARLVLLRKVEPIPPTIMANATLIPQGYAVEKDIDGLHYAMWLNPPSGRGAQKLRGLGFNSFEEARSAVLDHVRLAAKQR